MQDIIVILIGIVVFAYVGWKLYKLATQKPDPKNMCGGCTGCNLKEDLYCATNKKLKKKEKKRAKKK
jgi:hypothetical protein